MVHPPSPPPTSHARPLLKRGFSHGVQGTLDRASKAQLENEFGTKKADDAVQQVLEKGAVQETKSHDKQGGRNESNASGAGTSSNAPAH
jgi:hypothetical protein